MECNYIFWIQTKIKTLQHTQSFTKLLPRFKFHSDDNLVSVKVPSFNENKAECSLDQFYTVVDWDIMDCVINTWVNFLNTRMGFSETRTSNSNSHPSLWFFSRAFQKFWLCSLMKNLVLVFVSKYAAKPFKHSA